MAKRYFSPLSNIDFNTYGGRFKKGVVNGGVQQTTKGSTFSIYADDIILSTDYTGSYDSLSPGNINLIPTGAVFIGNSITPPTDTPSNGGYLYASNGSLTYKDSTGTVSNMNLNSITTFSELQGLTGPSTVYVRQGTTITATSSYTVPSNVNIIFLTGSSIYANSGVHVYFSGAIQSDHRCFFGPGFCSVFQTPINPLWWGGNPDPIDWECRFDKPGHYASYFASNGANCVTARTGTSIYLDNGALNTAAANEVIIDSNGILIEPAATQNLTSTDMANSLWRLSNATRETAQTDLLGGLTAVKFIEDTANSTHFLYNLVTTSGLTTFSCYVKYGSARYVGVNDNTYSHVALFDFTLKTISMVIGSASATALAEDVGGGWFRISFTTSAPTTGLVSFLHYDTLGTSRSFTGTSRYTYVCMPQLEQNVVPTSFIATPAATRAATTVNLAIPSYASDWTIEVDIRNAESVIRREVLAPIVAYGTYGQPESFCASLDIDKFKLSIWDTSGEKLATGSSMGTILNGLTTISFTLSKLTPALYRDGQNQAATISGDGYSNFKGYFPMSLRLGYASSGLQAGVHIYRIALKTNSGGLPITRPNHPYGSRTTIGHRSIARSKQPVFLGDSNTQANYSGVTSYCDAACAIKGSDYRAQNFGEGSNGSMQMLARWRQDLHNIAYAGHEHLFIFGGINDVNLLVDTSLTIDYLSTIYNEALATGLTIIPITVLPGTRITAIRAINSFISDYCAAGSLYRGASSSAIPFIDAFSLLGNNGSSSTIIAAANDQDGGSLHLSQTGQNALGTYAAAFIV
jgi:hypothetical protein